MAHAATSGRDGTRQSARHALQRRRRPQNALDIGAAPYGNWSGCHATGWDRYAPEFGDVNVGDQFQKHSYIFGC